MHKDMREFPFLWRTRHEWNPRTRVNVLKYDDREVGTARYVVGNIRAMMQLNESWWYLHQVSSTGAETADEVLRTDNGFANNICNTTHPTKHGWGVQHIVIIWDNNAPFAYMPVASPMIIRPRKGKFLNDLIDSDAFR
jgi:hypothetical protein